MKTRIQLKSACNAVALLAVSAIFAVVSRASAQNEWGNALVLEWGNVSAAIPRLASNYTVSAWVFLQSGGNFSNFRVGVLGAAPCGASAEVLIRSGTTAYTDAQYLELGRCGEFNGTASTNKVPVLVWVHVAVTVSSNKQVSYYINGADAGSWTAAGDVTIGPNITLGDNGVRRFNGKMDDVRIWGTTRTRQEIKADMCQPLSGTESNLVAYWKFDEGSGATAFDSTPNHHDATLNQAASWVPSTVSAPSVQLKVLSYNTHLFEDSTLECICKCGNWIGGCDWSEHACEDGTRIDRIADRVEASGADIVALQEVWAPAKQEAFMARLGAAYPYARNYYPPCDCRNSWPWYLEACVGGCLDATRNWKYYTMGSGLVLLSKYPFSDPAMKRFPTYTQCAIESVINCQDSWADKGVLTANVDVWGTPLRVGISHALTGPDDAYSAWDLDYRVDYVPAAITTFQAGSHPFIFALDKNNQGHISRIEDYGNVDVQTQATNYGAGWKHLYAAPMNPGYLAVVSFELDGHPYLFGLRTNNLADICRVNDDPATGWVPVVTGAMSSDYVALQPFELSGHPYLFGLHKTNAGHVFRVNDDPSTGWTLLHNGPMSADYAAVSTYELNGHAYLFGIYRPENNAYIRCFADDGKGWTNIHYAAMSAAYTAFTTFQLNGHPYLFGVHTDNNAYLRRINDDGKGWTSVMNKVWTSDYLAVRSFEIRGHPYLFALRNCCDQSLDAPGCRSQPTRVLLKRIGDDGLGWGDLNQLEDIRIIRDATIADDNGPPAIMMGDLNVHYWNYGIMNEIFRKAGAVDAYIEVHGTSIGGETINWHANKLMQWFTRNTGQAENTKVARIDYVYVKRSGSGSWLNPTDAYVIRDWTYRADNLDLSDHYPLVVEFNLQAASQGCRLTISRASDGRWQLATAGDVGRRYELQYSSDLRAWEKLLDFKLTNSPHFNLDSGAATASGRFYRVRALEQ
jgi:endonuclease/exonuclease/phosphatase family metal-dependent hydrolase